MSLASNCTLFWRLFWQVYSVLSKILQHFQENLLTESVHSQPEIWFKQLQLCQITLNFPLQLFFRGPLNGLFIEKKNPSVVFSNKSQKTHSLGVPLNRCSKNFRKAPFRSFSGNFPECFNKNYSAKYLLEAASLIFKVSL